MSTIADKIKSLGLVKADLKDALSEKGQNPGDTLSTYPDLIRNIETGNEGGEDTFSDPDLKWYFHYGIKKNTVFDTVIGQRFYNSSPETTPGYMIDRKIFTDKSSFSNYYKSQPDNHIFDVKLFYYRSPNCVYGNFFSGEDISYFYFSEDCNPFCYGSVAFPISGIKEFGIENRETGEKTLGVVPYAYSYGTNTFQYMNFKEFRVRYSDSLYKNRSPFYKTNVENFYWMDNVKNREELNDSSLINWIKGAGSKFKNVYIKDTIKSLYGESDINGIQYIENLVFSNPTPPTHLGNYYGYKTSSIRTIWCPTGSLDSYTEKFGSSWKIKETNSDGEITTD